MNEADVVIIGAGFTGLSAAYELQRSGHRCIVIEQDDQIGGLAGSFQVGTERLEKFYHHWFTNDQCVMELIVELGQQDKVVLRPTRTGMYMQKSFFKLSRPLDVLRFTPLRLTDRIRLGLMVFKARKVRDWRQLEDKTASQWLREIGGERVFRIVWEPLLRGKFGAFADEIGAVWIWNKLTLRGGSRDKRGAESLAYFKGGFAALAEVLADQIVTLGGEIRCNTSVTGLLVEDGQCQGCITTSGPVYAKAVLSTQPLPLFADIVNAHVDCGYAAHLKDTKYLANVCLVLQLNRSLSDTYWLNVADPQFPYVGVIEHTNFEPTATYGGRHIVYLSRYLPEDEQLFQMSDPDVFEFSLPYLQRMFPDFQYDWVTSYDVWRARYSQPIVGRNYSKQIPSSETPIRGLFLCSMAQIYPEDRGTNYAIREGRIAGRAIAAHLATASREIGCEPTEAR